MSLEQALKENTAAVTTLCDLMKRFKPDGVQSKAEKPETVKTEVKTEVKKEVKKPTVTLKQLQEVATTLIKAGGDWKTKAKAAIEELAGEGAKISGLPKHDDAATVMPAAFKALSALCKELEDEV